MCNTWSIEWYKFDGYQFIAFDDWYSLNRHLREDEAIRQYEAEKKELQYYHAQKMRDLSTNYSMDVAKEKQNLQCDLEDIETNLRQELLVYAIQTR